MVYIILGDGFEEIEAVAPGDILRRGGVRVSYVGVNGPQVRGAHDIIVSADIVMEPSLKFTREDLVVIPGGLGGVETIENSSMAIEVLKNAAEAGARFAAICAGPRVLSRLGLLEGRDFTCYPGMEDQISGGRYLGDKGAVSDNGIITGRSPGAAIDFGLALLEAIKGSQIAAEVRSELVYG
ncbi:MAG TPA: DJ-1 family protein [Clostridiales bacterium]|jgi:4-methyl-5(b-hydroxyethyl)-thiazole monophosphate biosynthesis|nr:DJ-1 family protein [Clostridiales bacterium]